MSNPYNNPDPIFSYQPLWGSWKVDSLIGEGSYGKVYKVIRSELGYTYTSAVKIITIPSKEQLREAVSSFGDEEDTLRSYFEGMVENILSEINLLYRLRGSPNIVVYEDHMVVAKKDSLGWDILLRMEHVTSLPSYLSRNRLNRENIIKLGLDICTAISLCAKNNIIHRDIKDENIFVSKDAVFKLGDFGIAKELSKSGKAASFRGTPLFMSPEVFRGEKYDVRSDIYSLGIVMYKLLNKGRVPFMPLYPEKVGYKDSENAIVKRFSGEAITLPTHSGKDLGSIVLKAISYRKEDRYKDPMEMKKALQEVLTTMDSKLLNEDVSFLTSAKEAKREDKTIPIFVPPPVDKPIIKEEKPPTKKEAKVSDKKDIVHKEPVVAGKPKTKTNITKKLLAIGIPSFVFILAVIALIVFMLFKTSGETSETVADETKISESDTQETVNQTVPGTTDSETINETVDTKKVDETTSVSEIPTIKLEIYEGPTSAEGGSICYYRVKAIVTGDPAPIIKFSKDDSNGFWGINIAQVNLNQGESYTLTASARNSEGTSEDSIALEWKSAEGATSVADTSVNSSGGDIYYNVVNGFEFRIVNFGYYNTNNCDFVPVKSGGSFSYSDIGECWSPYKAVWVYIECKNHPSFYLFNSSWSKNGNVYQSDMNGGVDEIGNLSLNSSIENTGPGSYRLDIYFEGTLVLTGSFIITE